MAMIGPLLRIFAIAAAAPVALAQQSTRAEFTVTPLAEKIVPTLPPAPLYWRVERFATATEAHRDAEPDALFVEREGTTWRFTLATGKAAAPGAAMVAEIGPVPVPAARAWRLRVNRGAGPPGAKTPVHTHPGSEAFYVLAGSLCQRTEHGTARLDPGRAMNGHGPGMTMQLESCGTAPLDQLVLFVLDADKPFSSPARF